MCKQIKTYKTGDVIGNHAGYCNLCSVKFGGSGDIQMGWATAKYLNGKWYHPHPCFVQAVDIALAEQRIKELQFQGENNE